MKRIILNISVFCTLVLSGVQAQDGISIQLDGAGPDISGGTHSLDLYATSPEMVGGVLDVHFLVTNTTGSDQQWKITRKKINVPASWTDQVCWPPLCYNTSGDLYSTPNSGGNPAPIIVDGTATTTNAEVAELKPRITPNQSAASYALYRYYITEAVGGAYVDSVDLSINFVLSVTTLKQTPIINVNPNPADEYVNISLGSIENSQIKIVDVLGNVVYNESVANGTKSIDVTGFKNGVYFVMIEALGIISTSRKLIVRH